jgi:exonuclease SbcD
MAADRFVFAHLADAHVGAWARDPSVRRALRESLLEAIRVARERDAEFLLVSGDLFHSPSPDPAEVAPVVGALRSFVDSGRRVYAIYGSHDYVAHRTSWLDVIAEAGVFVPSASDAVRPEGERWTLRYRRDAPTGVVIAGISGRAHGLDRSYFAAVDSEAFRAEPGYKIFQFHAAVNEFLPPGLREHIRGISVADLPGGCAYYAGGHIHRSYVGEGPDGGLLVNPGAVFGTSVKDLETALTGETHQGLAIVTVENGESLLELIDTAPREALRVFDVDVEGQTPEDAARLVKESIGRHASAGALLFPKVHGTLVDGAVRGLGLRDSLSEATSLGAAGVHWDLREVSVAAPGRESGETEGEIEARALHRLAEEAPAELEELRGEVGEVRLKDLVRELGTARGEGEAQRDYTNARVTAALRVLGVESPPKKREAAE